jgi:hypothetical protein
MDYVNKLTGSGEKKPEGQQATTSGEQKQGGGMFSGIGNKMNNAAGGGAAGEKNEDYLDKGGYCPATMLNDAELTTHRCRLCPREVPRCGSSERRVCPRAGQG